MNFFHRSQRIIWLVLVISGLLLSLPLRGKAREKITIEGVYRRAPRPAYHYGAKPDTIPYDRLLSTGDMPLIDKGETRPIYRPLADSRRINTSFPHGAAGKESTAVDEYGANEFFLISTGVTILIFLSF